MMSEEQQPILSPRAALAFILVEIRHRRGHRARYLRSGQGAATLAWLQHINRARERDRAWTQLNDREASCGAPDAQLSQSRLNGTSNRTGK